MSLKISIIIPTFNRHDFLVKAINSALPIKKSEIIVVDDLSNEEIKIKNRDFINSLVSQGHKIKFLEPETKAYLSEARNIGIREAKGQWLFFLDDDDYILENFVEWLNSKENISDNNVFQFKYLINGRPVSRVYKKNYFWSVQVSTFLIKRQFLLESNLFFEKNYLYEDNIFAAKVYDKQNTVFIPYEKKITSINYSLSQSSIMRSKVESLKQWEKTFNFFYDSNLMMKEQWMMKVYCEAYKFLRYPSKVTNKKDSLSQLKEMKKKIKSSKAFWNLPFYFKYFYAESKLYFFFRRKK